MEQKFGKNSINSLSHLLAKIRNNADVAKWFWKINTISPINKGNSQIGIIFAAEIHLVYNRINDEGKTITDQNDFRRNEQVTKLLKRKYGLTFSKGKGRTKTERLRGTEKTKYEIYHAVGTGLLRCKSWPEFVNHLKANGVEVELVMRRNAKRRDLFRATKA